jgi:hypothetical protein
MTAITCTTVCHKRNIGWNRDIKEISFKGMGFGFEKGKTKSGKQPSIGRGFISIKMKVAQEELTAQGYWPTMKEMRLRNNKRNGTETKRNGQQRRSGIDEDVN